MSGPGADLIFDSLSDRTRRRIMRMIAEGGPATATELAARLPITRQAAAKHLATLAAAGIVTATRQGREVRYEIDAGSLEAGSRWLAEVNQQWGRRMAALRRHVTE